MARTDFLPLLVGLCRRQTVPPHSFPFSGRSRQLKVEPSSPALSSVPPGYRLPSQAGPRNFCTWTPRKKSAARRSALLLPKSLSINPPDKGPRSSLLLRPYSQSLPNDARLSSRAPRSETKGAAQASLMTPVAVSMCTYFARFFRSLRSAQSHCLDISTAGQQ